jgi:branched-chain amino acid transport system ATP-binding protein
MVARSAVGVVGGRSGAAQLVDFVERRRGGLRVGLAAATAARGGGMNDHATLVLEGVVLRHGETTVLDGVNLTVRRGERLALIGPNGAGKSSLFKVIAGEQAPCRGTVTLNGQRIDGLPMHAVARLGLARSFQVSQLFGAMSVRDNLNCAALSAMGERRTWWRALSGLNGLRERVDATLARLGLSAQANTPARALSYADQRALELGMAVVGDAPVILLDEPTAGMGADDTQRFTELIRELTEGKTLVTVEHDMGVVMALADRVAVLVRGQVVALDSPQAVRADPVVQAAYWQPEARA